jgi:SAM-dependent methyltransferase
MTNKMNLEDEIARSKQLRAGSEHYRAYVGPPGQFDFMGATQFALLFAFGLREEHSLLDVGCGSLRAGRLVLQFLLPGRYVGVEPNSWLWRDALASEIGEDIARLKAPQFVEDDSFSLTNIGRHFDFIMFQSVLSHTGGNMFDRPLAQSAQVLAPGGQLLFTVLDESTPNFLNLRSGNEAPGWQYPNCITYMQDDVIARCARAGLHAQKLRWFHPRQSWYRAVIDAGKLLSEADLEQVGTGRPLFDDRFA